MTGLVKELTDGYIYEITHKDTGKFYIGKCERAPENSEGYYGSGTYIRRAIAKYGLDRFEKKIISRGYTNTIALELAEMSEISLRDATNVGYNLTEGGEGGNIAHIVWTPEKMASMRESRWGKFPVDARSYEDMYGDKAEEIKAKQSVSHKAYNSSEEGVAKRNRLSAAYPGEGNQFYGKDHSDEAKQKIKESKQRLGSDRVSAIAKANSAKGKTPEAMVKFLDAKRTRFDIILLDGTEHIGLKHGEAVRLLGVTKYKFNSRVRDAWKPTELPNVKEMKKYYKENK